MTPQRPVSTIGLPCPDESPPRCCEIMQPGIKSNPMLLEIVDCASIVPEAIIFPPPHVMSLVKAPRHLAILCSNALYWNVGSGRFHDLILRHPCVLEKLHRNFKLAQ